MIGLVDEAIERYNIDEDKIYFMGHSNGGFMSYTMACEYGDRIAAIGSLAGTTFSDPQRCPNIGNVSILHVHGTADTTIAYEGSQRVGFAFPGAVETAERWAARNECPTDAIEKPKLDLVDALQGSETKVQQWTGCSGQTEVELWTMEGAGHTPRSLKPAFSQTVLKFLLAHSK